MLPEHWHAIKLRHFQRFMNIFYTCHEPAPDSKGTHREDQEVGDREEVGEAQTSSGQPSLAIFLLGWP